MLWIAEAKIVSKVHHILIQQNSGLLKIKCISFLLQEILTPAIKHQILSELRSFPDLCDCLAALDIAIGFLVNAEVDGTMRIKDYLHKMLKLPSDRGLRHSAKVIIMINFL